MALGLARLGFGSRVVCLEAGVDCALRSCSVLEQNSCRRVTPCQIVGGVGGASVLSGGKISAFPAGRSMAISLGDDTDACLDNALRLFQEFVPLEKPTFSDDAKRQAQVYYGDLGFEYRYYDAFLYQQSDLICGYQRMQRELEAAGTEIHLSSRAVSISRQGDGFHVDAIIEGQRTQVHCQAVIFAGGRTGAKLLATLAPQIGLSCHEGVLDVGVRLEFPSAIWPTVNAAHNDLKLHFGGHRTFCVCKDGWVAPYRVGNIFLTEGHAETNRRTGFTNLAITTRRNGTPTGLFEEIGERVEAISGGKPVRQRLGDFLAGRASEPSQSHGSSISFWEWGNVADCFPSDVTLAVSEGVDFLTARLLPHGLADISVFGPEVDRYWPRYWLADGFQTEVPGMYIIGDASGQFRGILQAFCSGLSCAAQLVKANQDR
jgi:uncharacterized protein